jgi:hypothetical protein
MAGMPQRRARQTPKSFPARVPAHIWRTWSEVERIKALFGGSLEDILNVVSVPYQEADLHERNLKVRVFEILMRTGLQLLERQDRDAFREKVLDALGPVHGRVASTGQPRSKPE